MKRLLISSVLILVSWPALADPIDLSSWSELTLDFPGGQPSGNWILESGNEAVKQVVNADPSFFLNNLNQTQFTIEGSWEVQTASDNDYMGFVFGYQNSSNFYLFDWKQASQNYASATALEGMTIKKFTGSTGDGLTDLSLGEFWSNSVGVGNSFGDMTVLATNHGGTTGWDDNTVYDFKLDFLANPNEISITVMEGATELWDVTVYDSTFSSGEFGFYNYSQSAVRYAGFEQTGGVVVPEPSAFILLGLGMLGLGISSRKSRNGNLSRTS